MEGGPNAELDPAWRRASATPSSMLAEGMMEVGAAGSPGDGMERGMAIQADGGGRTLADLVVGAMICDRGLGSSSESSAMRLAQSAADPKDLDQRSGQHGMTPLMEACCYGHWGVMRVLLENGADPNVDCDGEWPLRVALSSSNGKGRPQAIKALVRAGARVDQLGIDGRSALHKAFRRFGYGGWDGQAATALLALGADPLLRDPKGWGPAHYAVDSGRPEAVEAAAAAGADFAARDMDGRTPRDLALELRRGRGP